jgi:hypothetical protein
MLLPLKSHKIIIPMGCSYMLELSDPSSAVHGPLGHEERDISIRPSSWHKKLLSNFSKDVDSNSSVLSKEK